MKLLHLAATILFFVSVSIADPVTDLRNKFNELSPVDIPSSREVTKTLKEAGRDINQFANKIRDGVIPEDERKKVEKNFSKAIKDTYEAAEAAARFVGRQAVAPGKAFDQALHQRNPLDSLSHLATARLRYTHENAKAAVTESHVLAAGAGVAASVYGGPAGAAAYSAWMTYNATGDLNAAIKVGVTNGAIAYVTQSAGAIENPVQRKAAQQLISVAKQKMEGASTAEIRAGIAKQLVSDLTTKFSEKRFAEFGSIEKTIATARGVQKLERGLRQVG